MVATSIAEMPSHGHALDAARRLVLRGSPRPLDPRPLGPEPAHVSLLDRNVLIAARGAPPLTPRTTRSSR